MVCSRDPSSMLLGGFSGLQIIPNAWQFLLQDFVVILIEILILETGISKVMFIEFHQLRDVVLQLIDLWTP